MVSTLIFAMTQTILQPWGLPTLTFPFCVTVSPFIIWYLIHSFYLISLLFDLNLFDLFYQVILFMVATGENPRLNHKLFWYYMYLLIDLTYLVLVGSWTESQVRKIIMTTIYCSKPSPILMTSKMEGWRTTMRHYKPKKRPFNPEPNKRKLPFEPVRHIEMT